MALAANLVKVALLVVRSGAPTLNQLQSFFPASSLQRQSDAPGTVWRDKQICCSTRQKCISCTAAHLTEFRSLVLLRIVIKIAGPIQSKRTI